MEYTILRTLFQMKKTIYSKQHAFIVQRLKKAREEAKLDQKQVAKALHRTQSYVSKIESGQRRIDLVQLNYFAKIYGKSLDFFIQKNNEH
jgi:transcriptional regulator with XRE-family HTH domain